MMKSVVYLSDLKGALNSNDDFRGTAHYLGLTNV